MLRVAVVLEPKGRRQEARPLAELLVVNLGAHPSGDGFNYGFRLHEDPSRFGPGLDVYGLLRRHNGDQPAWHFVASVMDAWSNGAYDPAPDDVKRQLQDTGWAYVAPQI